jgi:hypothetical protein
MGGILCMIVFTALSLIAPFFLNIPINPCLWLQFLYLVLIAAQIVLLINYSRYAVEKNLITHLTQQFSKAVIFVTLQKRYTMH